MQPPKEIVRGQSFKANKDIPTKNPKENLFTKGKTYLSSKNGFLNADGLNGSISVSPDFIRDNFIQVETPLFKPYKLEQLDGMKIIVHHDKIVRTLGLIGEEVSVSGWKRTTELWLINEFIEEGKFIIVE